MKRLWGITLLGIFLTIAGIGSFIVFFAKAYPVIKGTSASWVTPIFAFLYLISGIGILFLKSWARWIAIGCSLYFAAMTTVRAITWLQRFGDASGEAVGQVVMSGALTVAVHLFVLYYLTRSKVKEQFKTS